MTTRAELDLWLVEALASAVAQAKKMQARHNQIGHPAVKGEFLTHLRRGLRKISGVSKALHFLCCDLANRKLWDGIAVPSHSFWHNLTAPAVDGTWELSCERIDQLCKQARLQEKYLVEEKEPDNQITSGLSRLENDILNLRTRILISENINIQAQKVISDLYHIVAAL